MSDKELLEIINTMNDATRALREITEAIKALSVDVDSCDDHLGDIDDKLYAIGKMLEDKI